jgi:hypothetical protein
VSRSALEPPPSWTGTVNVWSGARLQGEAWSNFDTEVAPNLKNAWLCRMGELEQIQNKSPLGGAIVNASSTIFRDPSLDNKSIFHISGYSYLKESIGLTFEARLAGTKLAKRTTAARRIDTLASVATSNGLTP